MEPGDESLSPWPGVGLEIWSQGFGEEKWKANGGGADGRAFVFST